MFLFTTINKLKLLSHTLSYFYAFPSQHCFTLPQTESHLISFYPWFALWSPMEVNTTTTTIVPTGPPTAATKNPTFTRHHLHSEKHNHTHDDHFPFKTVLITVAVAAFITVLFIIFLVVCFIRRQKSSSSKNNGTCKDDSSRSVLHHTSSRLITSTMLNFNASPGKLLTSWRNVIIN